MLSFVSITFPDAGGLLRQGLIFMGILDPIA
jgi:hypothetical protein